MLNRRRFLGSAAGLAAGSVALARETRAADSSRIETASMRGSIDATHLGIRPGAFDDQSKAFGRMLQKASDSDIPVFLPAGVYVVSNIQLPRKVRLSGVSGATRIIYGGDGYLMAADDTDIVSLSGIVFDGANRWIGDQSQGLLDLRHVNALDIDNCQIVGSGKNGLALERVSGRVGQSTISGAADAGIYSVEAGSLSISGNTVGDCANGGILVHRWNAADDGTMIVGNRVERIRARNGGTGQFGNGINAFRANNVTISGNHVADCAFSAIRANSSSNLQIIGNSALRSGETAIYAEFAFEGAVINANIVDHAANGISMVNFNNGGRMAACNGNIVRNLAVTGPYEADQPGFGVGMSVEADCAVTGNVIENAPLYGLQIGWGKFMRNVVATGNIVRNSQTGIAVSVVPGVGSAVISDNVIQGAEKGSVVGFEWATPATGELANEGAGGFAHMTVERNRVS